MLEKMPEQIEKINELIQEIKQGPNLLEFERIELPFKLVASGIKLWEEIYSPERLRQLARTDAETLDAWAIGLCQTLQTLQTLLESWLPHLSTLPLPPALKQKISDSQEELTSIINRKSQLLQSLAGLLSQEQTLVRETTELRRLKEKENSLQILAAELEATDLESLRSSISRQAKALEPQKQIRESLQQEKAQLDAEMTALELQSARLREEIQAARSRHSRLETSTGNTATELITLTKAQRDSLSTALESVLADTEQQQTDYNQMQQQLNKAIQDFNQYQTATEEIRHRLVAHYQSDRDLGTLLPVNRERVDNLIGAIEENLAELDRELAAGQRENERSLGQSTLRL